VNNLFPFAMSKAFPCSDSHQMAGKKNKKFKQNLKKWLWKKKKTREEQKNKDQPGLRFQRKRS
jgi:hypothetical protein